MYATNTTISQSVAARAVTVSALAVIMISALLIRLPFLTRNLPWSPEVDEPMFVEAAVRIAASGDLNPHWFGNPASTTIYPLAAAYRIWGAWASLKFAATPSQIIINAYNNDFSGFYLAGRLLSALYAMVSLPFVYLISRRLTNRAMSMLAVLLVAVSPLVIYYSTVVRSDSAGLFFVLLAIWLILHAGENPTLRRFALAGLAIGGAIASRYFMVSLIAPLLLVAGEDGWRQGRRRLAVSLIAAAVAFVATTPFLFFDLGAATSNLWEEARGEHLGTDGYSILGNALWYVVIALPASIGLAQCAAAGIGLGAALVARHRTALVLLFFSFSFIGLISTPSLHWQRWVIQLLPIVAIFSVFGLTTLMAYGQKRYRLSKKVVTAVGVLATMIMLITPVTELSTLTKSMLTPSTRLLARAWILAHVPAGSRLGIEFYGPPLIGAPVTTSYPFSLSERSFETYRREGYNYLIINERIEAAMRRQPERYIQELMFYDELRAQARPAWHIAPAMSCPLDRDDFVAACGSPPLTIYEL